MIAAWARDTKDGLKLRSTPQIMLALAAAHPQTKPLVPKYAKLIMRRADEIRQVFGAFRHLFMASDDEAKADDVKLVERLVVIEVRCHMPCERHWHLLWPTSVTQTC